MVKCDIIVITWNQLENTKILVNSLFKYTDIASRLIVVDNGSREKTRNFLNSLRAQGQIKAIRLIFNEKNEGAAKARNQGLKESDADFVCFLDNDVEVTPGWLSRMKTLLERVKEIGMLSADSNTFGSRPAKDVCLESYAQGLQVFANQYEEVGHCATFCVLIRREVIDKVGLFDEGYRLLMYEDTDYSMRVIRAGYICAVAKGAYIWHYEHKTSGRMKGLRETVEANKRRYCSKWGKLLRIIYILNEKAELEECKEAYQSAVELARRGNFIYLFINNGQGISVEAFLKRYNLIRHHNIHFILYSGKFFNFFCFRRILKRTKKKYDIIIFSKEEIMPIYNFFQIIHKSEVININERQLIESAIKKRKFSY